MKVGFIGLGRMGRGMALNLARSVHDLVVYDINADAMDDLVAAGAKAALSVSEVTQSSDVLFTSLPGPPQVDQVVLGEGGILESVSPGKVLFELSTSSPELAMRIGEEFAERGAHMLDAPVSGGPAGAESGDLAFWVGGDRDVYERFLPVLRCMGDKPKHCGKVGAGTVVKLAHNLTGHLILRSLAETFSLGVKAGVEPLELWDAMRLGVVGKQPALEMLTKHFLPASYDVPSFALNLAYKDVSLATQLGRSLGVPMELSDRVFADMTRALERGLGDQDARAYLQLQLDRAGVAIAVDPADIEARKRAG